MTEEEWNTYEQAIKHEMDNKNIELGKLEEAEEQGIKKGAEDRSKEIALKMLKRNRPLDEIVEDTGLSMEEIKPFKPNSKEPKKMQKCAKSVAMAKNFVTH